MKRSLLLMLVLVSTLFLLVSFVVLAQDAPATVVYGQPDFVSGAANRGGGASAETLNYPLGLALAPDGGLYIADRNNHRVLYYANDGNQAADRVYGQCDNLNTYVANNNCTNGNSSGPSANNLNNPTAVGLDAGGGLYVADRDNHRVLYYAPDGNTTADRIYGQFGSFGSFMTSNNGRGDFGEPSAENFGTYILGLVVDSTGGFYVADSSGHRILYFAPDGDGGVPDTVADRVYGQDDDFTTDTRNKNGVSARSFQFPRGLSLDSADGLYVADRDNNRVLYFANDGDTTADRVYGQGDNFSANAEAHGVGGLSHPKAVAVDANGGVWVTDSLNHRLVYYANDGDTTADRVLGQAGSFDTNVVNNDGAGNSGAPSVANFNLPQGIMVAPDGRLIMTDTGNNRALVIPVQ